MCGLAAKFLPNFMKATFDQHKAGDKAGGTGKTDLYRAGAMCGRNSAVGGFFNTFPIPFGKSAVVTVRAAPQVIHARIPAVNSLSDPALVVHPSVNRACLRTARRAAAAEGTSTFAAQRTCPS